MFRVENSFKLHIPAELDGPDCAGHFFVAEVIGNRPMWLVHALSPALADGLKWWQTFLVDHVTTAVEFTQSDSWLAYDLYVLLPPHIAHSGGPRLCRCDLVVQCEEPDATGVCWRVELPGVTFLESALDTPLGREVPQRIVWRANDEVEKHAPA